MLVNHDPDRVIGRVVELDEWDDTTAAGWSHGANSTHPPGWLRGGSRGTAASMSWIDLSHSQEMPSGWRRYNRGLVTEVSVLTHGFEPVETLARVVLLQRSTATSSAPTTRASALPADGEVIHLPTRRHPPPARRSGARRSVRRRKPPGATTRGGWGKNHQRRRAALVPYVNTGKATCVRCNEPIDPGDDWHLDHNDSRDGYLGVSHARCNLRDGANKTNDNARPTPTSNSPTGGRNAGSTTRPSVPPSPRQGQGRDLRGNGEWHTVDADALARLENRARCWISLIGSLSFLSLWDVGWQGGAAALRLSGMGRGSGVSRWEGARRLLAETRRAASDVWRVALR